MLAEGTISRQIWESKYRYKSKDGKPIDVTVKDTWKRVAKALALMESANKEEWTTKFYECLENFRFLPGGRIISNAGTERKKTTLMNCYVLPIHDSMDGIFDAVKWSALTQKQGGGVGFDFSVLRPKGSYVSGVESYSSGPISFMRVFDSTCATIMSAGCLTGDTLIETDKGLIDIRTIVTSNDSLKVKTHLGYKRITNKFDNGKKKTYELTFENNQKIRATKEHKFFFFNDNGQLAKRPVSKLNIGDYALSFTEDRHLDSSDDGGVFYFLKIKDIRECEIEQVYDIEVEDAHGYVANGVYVSNSRRGAMIAVFRVDHPDIEDFIDAKRDNVSFKNFNLSVAITADFMKAVKEDKDWDLVFEGKVYKTVKAQYLWSRIIESNYNYAEPGVLFIDRINKMNNLHYCEVIRACNPCGEICMPEFSSCLLGSVNLSRFVTNPFEQNAVIDYDAIKKTVAVAVRMLDNAIELSKYPLPEQEKEAKTKRRMGLGVTGVADMFCFLGVKYGSDDSIKIANLVMKCITHQAYLTSIELAKERGPFERFQKEEYLKSQFVKMLPKDIQEGIEKHGIRNSHLTAIAPTGTISIFAENTSSGIEPIFATSYNRRVRNNNGDDYTEQLVMDYAVTKFKEKFGDKEFPEYFVTTKDITPKQHIAIQSAFQKFVDSSISKTVNVSADIGIDEFKSIYMDAYECGLKGCTIYRPNENIKSILSVDGPKFVDNHAPKRPEKLPCDIHHFRSGGKNWVAFVGMMDGRPYECFAGLAEEIQVPNSKNAYIVKRRLVHNSKYDLHINEGLDDEICVKDMVSRFKADQYASVMRLISLSLRHRAPAKYLAETLEKDDNDDLYSFYRGLQRIFKKYIINGSARSGVCPQCNSGELIYQDGCPLCNKCGWSKCS